MELSLSITEFAKQINKSHQAIHKYCNDHDIPLISGKGRSFISPESVRKYLMAFNYTYPKKTISFQACKGGVGKTSLCYNIASRSAQYGANVLVIDLDMQGHITMALLNPSVSQFPVWNDIISGVDISSIIQEVTNNLHIIPSNLDNSYLDKQISQSHKIIYANYVLNHIKKIRDKYDFIFIDCSPALSHINTAAAIASDKVLIPVNPDLFSFDGLEKTLHELKEIESEFNSEMDVSIILNRFDARERNSLDVIANLKNNYGPLLSPNVVAVSTEIKNAIMKGELLFKMKKRPAVADDIDAITKDILNFGKAI